MPKISNPYIVSTSTQFIPKILRKMGDIWGDSYTQKIMRELCHRCKHRSRKSVENYRFLPNNKHFPEKIDKTRSFLLDNQTEIPKSPPPNHKFQLTNNQY
jgi:hypothetical protein